MGNSLKDHRECCKYRKFPKEFLAQQETHEPGIFSQEQNSTFKLGIQDLKWTTKGNIALDLTTSSPSIRCRVAVLEQDILEMSENKSRTFKMVKAYKSFCIAGKSTQIKKKMHGLGQQILQMEHSFHQNFWYQKSF